MRRLGLLWRADRLLLFAAAGLAAYGAVFVTSAGENFYKHLLWIAIGLTGFLVAFLVDYRIFLKHAYPIFAFSLFTLVAVLFTRPINGASSWFKMGGISIQPSEFMKLAFVLALAKYLMYRNNYRRLEGLTIPLLVALVPLGLILRQPDLGTAMVFVPILFAMLYAAGSRLRHLSLVSAGGVAGLAGLWLWAMKPYQQTRIHAWLNPELYRLREAWQLIHSQIAIGSGGFAGKGLGWGTIHKLHLLPEAHTDFIFAVVAEEWGLVGAMGLIALVLLLGFAGVRIATRVREPAGRLVAVGLTVMFLAQSLINISVAVGLLPTTGITLPFVSYGGSSMLASFVALGLIANIGARRVLVLAPDDFA